MFTESISYSAALIAGLLSFFSPCIFPLIPAYFTFITGLSLDELTEARYTSIRAQIILGSKPDLEKLNGTGIRARVVLSTLSYVLGFSLVFILLGASASFIGAPYSNTATGYGSSAVWLLSFSVFI